MPKVVMAYSGGLESTACIHWLRHRKGFEVLTLSADLGQSESAETLSQRALSLGVDSVHIADLRENFLTDFVFPALRAGARSESGSYLSVALSRLVITREVVSIAGENNCAYIAHGSRGKSNDQVRFVLSAASLAPKLNVIAPLREQLLTNRKLVIEYARKYDLPVTEADRTTYNNDYNVWGTCISSVEIEDLWKEPPEVLYRMTANPADAPEEPLELVVEFEHGLPVSLDGERKDPLELVMALNKLAGEHGVGRRDVTETSTVGIKTRQIYETPAAEVLHRAHRALEEICLPADIMQAQQESSRRYSMLAYRGDWFTPLRETLDEFFVASQRRVTGRVRIRLFKGMCTMVGRESRFSLFDKELATSGEHDSFDHSAAHGFLDIIAIKAKLEARQQQTEQEGG